MDDREKCQENAESNDNAADDKKVNSNDDGQNKQYCCSRKVKPFLKCCRSQNFSTCMSADTKI